MFNLNFRQRGSFLIFFLIFNQKKDLLESVADDPNLHEKITILTRSFQNEQLRLQNDELVFVENNLEGKFLKKKMI